MRQNDFNGEKRPLRDPWLVAVWPGMGQVAATAGTYLLERFQPEAAAMLPEREFFDLNHVEVANGIARAGRLPRNMFFTWRDPRGRRDLVIFLAESQPAARGYELCRRIMDVAVGHGVQRVVTFAAMGTQLHPTAQPRVFGAVTTPDLLPELRREGCEPLREGRVGGLNGVLLAAAAERDVPGVCLLGEMPFYAAAVPNPRSSLAVLEVFSDMADLVIDTSRLEALAGKTESKLVGLLEQLREQAGEMDEEDAEIFEGMEREQESEERHELDPASRRRIEKLFDAAQRDRARAEELKAELDRLGVFEEYEDRFLDLFRRAG